MLQNDIANASKFLIIDVQTGKVLDEADTLHQARIKVAERVKRGENIFVRVYFKQQNYQETIVTPSDYNQFLGDKKNYNKKCPYCSMPAVLYKNLAICVFCKKPL
jgi:hypothetical protein